MDGFPARMLVFWGCFLQKLCELQQVELAAPFDTKVLECGLTAGCVLTAVSRAWLFCRGGGFTVGEA